MDIESREGALAMRVHAINCMIKKNEKMMEIRGNGGLDLLMEDRFIGL